MNVFARARASARCGLSCFAPRTPRRPQPERRSARPPLNHTNLITTFFCIYCARPCCTVHCTPDVQRHLFAFARRDGRPRERDREREAENDFLCALGYLSSRCMYNCNIVFYGLEISIYCTELKYGRPNKTPTPRRGELRRMLRDVSGVTRNKRWLSRVLSADA